ncbi:MAG: DUF434 domain-containing protein [Deltaproteobacteria bacterium]|nr:DUF434 domain-containing protein [Deltaproteobacteria bacterium]
MQRRLSIDLASLRKGAEDLRYLLGRGYPRKNSLDLVGNRYGLERKARELLHRGVFSQADAGRRRERRIPMEGVRGSVLAADGHNVLITIEAALRREPLVMADDSFIRDVSGISSSYKMGEVTIEAVDLLIEVLVEFPPQRIVFLFDSPISKSGLLALHVARRLRAANLAGESRAVKVPERILMGHPGVVATSDSAIIDRVDRVVDLAGHVIETRIPQAWLITL